MSTDSRAAAFVGRTAWGRNLAAPVRDFLSTETGGAVPQGNRAASPRGDGPLQACVRMRTEARSVAAAHCWPT
jgi:hypothetical protein